LVASGLFRFDLRGLFSSSVGPVEIRIETHKLKMKFVGCRVYSTKLRHRLDALGVATLHPAQAEGDVIDRFSTYILNYDYDLFGTLTTGSNNRSVAAGVQTQL
jgi:hypothetical protein